MKKVLVLLSTYNGEKYLRCQMDSLLAQTGVDVHVLVRDDGSKDSTMGLLSEYASQHHNITVLKDVNVGCIKSFMQLMQEADRNYCDYDYYALCDQDDYWLPNKLSVASETLDAKYDAKRCMLYHSTYDIVDERLNHIAYSRISVRGGLGEAVVRNGALGCTMVFNKKLLHYCAQLDIQSDHPALPYHDLWVYLVACALDGIIVTTNDYNLKYRQHSNNEIGLKDSVWKVYWRRYDNLRKHKGMKSGFAEILLKHFEPVLTEQNRDVLRRCVHYRDSLFTRLKLCFSEEFKTSNPVVNIGFKISVLLKWF